MDYFFGFDTKLSKPQDWFFNLNHLFLILMVASIVIGFYFLLTAKSEKGKKVTKLVLASVLFVFEVGRIIYKLVHHFSGGGTASNFNWWWSISFQMCAIMCWNTIITLILSAFLKKDNKFLQLMYNILFGCALVGGVLTFCYPDCISSDLPILHFENFQTILIHSLLIFVPIYFIKTKDFKVEIKNIWKPIVGYIYVGCVAMIASIISGQNFAYALECDLLTGLGLNIPFPWHLPVVLAIVYSIAVILYLAFYLVQILKNRKNKQQSMPLKEKKKPNYLYIFSVITTMVVSTIMLLTISIPLKQIGGMIGLVLLIPLAYLVVGLILSELFARKDIIVNEKNNTSHIIIMTALFVLAMPVGFVYLAEYLKKREVKNA